jgi:hypothetical protein
MRSVGGVVGGQLGAALLAAYTIPGTHGIPAERGFILTFAISSAAAVVGVVLACLVPEPERLRLELAG